MSDIRALRVAKILQEARTAKGVTQEWVAEAAEVSLPTVKRAEGRGSVGAESLRALCAVLDLDAEDVLARARRAVAGVPGGDGFLREAERPVTPADNMAAACWLWGMLPSTGVVALVPAALFWAYPSGAGGLTGEAFRQLAGGCGVVALVLAMVAGVAASLRFHDGLGRAATPAQRLALAASVGFTGLAAVTAPAAVLLAAAENADTSAVIGLLAGLAHTLLGLALVKAVEGSVERDRRQARARFVKQMPGLITAMRTAAGALHDPGRLERLAELLAAAQALADAAGRAPDIVPLEYLVEDVHRGVSGRKGLFDYLALAERTCGREPLSGRAARDARCLTDELRRRVVAFA